ncbi:hypothetical protein LCGC14_1504470 [marine sediment metagenome]|uniref:Uncharacterized protein n=1 Tax=marine sediment metagenome TaxID=412755 RepID=A0A0F9JNX3_9ZZZZ
MAAKQFPKSWPPLVVREFEDFKQAYRVLRDLVRSLDNLRRKVLEVGNDHAVLIDYSISATDSITSGTTQTQAGATVLSSRFNRVTTHGNVDDGIKLPTAVVGREVIILNDTAVADLQVWPATGDAIEAAAVDAVGVTKIGAGVATTYEAVDAITWYITNQHTTP